MNQLNSNFCIRIFLIAISLSFCMQCVAQRVWNKTYLVDRPAALFSSVISEDTSYKVIGMVSDKLPPYYGRAFAASINSSGDVIKYRTGIDSAIMEFRVFTNSLIRTNQNDYAYTGYAYDSLIRLLFVRFDSALNSFNIYTYYTPNTYAFFGSSLVQLSSNSYLIAGTRTDNTTNDADVVLVKLDSSGNRVWEKYYNRRVFDYAKSMIKLDNGKIMIGAVRNDQHQNIEHANTWLLTVDTAGNFVSQWFDPNDSTYAAEGLMQTADGGFMYAAQKKYEQFVYDVTFTATIVKLNRFLQKQWTFNGGLAAYEIGFSDIIELPDGNIVACGKYSLYQAWIIKLTATGQVIWDRKYLGLTDSSAWNYLTDIDVLPNGDLIAVGQCQWLGNSSPQYGWFLKLDSNGCEIENCTVGISPFSDEHNMRAKLKVYPNPSGGVVKLDIERSLLDGEIRVTDLTGKLVINRRVDALVIPFDLSAFSKGMYIITVEKEGTIERVKLMIQ